MRNTISSFFKLFLIIAGMICISSKTTYGQSYWQTNGNSVSNGSFLGTTNNQPLPFYVNNHQAMVILSNGNVGIGTLSPNYPLQIVGDVLDSGTIYANYIESA